LQQAQPHELRSLPNVEQRIEAVKAFRLASKKAPTRELAKTPRQFENNILPQQSFLVIPETSSENREYLPIGYLKPPVIPSNAIRLMLNAQLWHFAILTSKMHMAWVRQFAGRLKSDYRYSVGVVYNAFPWPQDLKENSKAQEHLSELAQHLLDTRANYPQSTLADLYHALHMPPDLRKAHAVLDKAVDKLYQSKPFNDDSERVALLFARYEVLTAQRS